MARIKNLLLAETLSQSGGDLTIVKLIRGGIVIHPPSPPPPPNVKPALPSLALVAVIDGLVGVEQLRPRVRVTYNGTVTSQHQPEQWDRRDPVAVHTWSHMIVPFVVPGFGDYSFQLEVDLDNGETLKAEEVLNISLQSQKVASVVQGLKKLKH